MESVLAPPAVTPDECAVTTTLAFVGSKSTPLVIYHLSFGTKRYRQLQQALPGVSPKTLADRLRALEDEGLVTRTVHPDKHLGQVEIAVRHCSSWMVVGAERTPGSSKASSSTPIRTVPR
jgi:DNA-binding HxlR family transcriptional regulator